MKVYGNKVTLGVVNSCAKANLPLLLMGETGVGKTTIVREAAIKHKKKVTRINLNGQTGREEILGKYVLEGGATIRQDGPMLTALRNGDRILLDEINAALPEVLFTLQALIETRDGKLGEINLVEKDGEVVIPHKDCRIFATANPADRYIGAKDFNIATLSRFVVAKVDKLSSEKELELLIDMFPKTNSKTIVQAVSIGDTINTEHAKEEIAYFCSTRDIIQSLEIHKQKIPFKTAIDTAILNKVQNAGDVEIVEKIVNKILKTKIVIPEGVDIIAAINNATTLKAERAQLEADKKASDKKIKELQAELKKLTEVQDTFKEARNLFSNIST